MGGRFSPGFGLGCRVPFQACAQVTITVAYMTSENSLEMKWLQFSEI